MIINTGLRTDIPAFYSEWFCGRLKEGYACVRNPFNPRQVSRYKLNPDVVDVIGFCTKNPAPMLPHMDLLRDYGQYWFVTITSYGHEIEPGVPDKRGIIDDFKRLSRIVGINSIGWRYDPIFISERYSCEYHIRAFLEIAKALEGYTRTAVISFIDLYRKVKKNFPKAVEPSAMERERLGIEMAKIAGEHGMTLKPCAEGDFLEKYGADCSGCMTAKTYEKAIGRTLNVPKEKKNRAACACHISCDIGAYDTCMHLCRYCYANESPERVKMNTRRHDPKSPFLVGNYEKGDDVHDARQKSWADGQLKFF